MDAATLFGSGNLHYVNEEYEEALKHYTCAVTLQDCANYRAARAAAFLKLGKLAETLEDAEAALKFEPKSHMALHWRGVALFYMGDFANAKAAFEGSLRANPSAKAPRALWLRKCDAELSGSTLPLGGLTTEASKAGSAIGAAPAAAAPAVAAPAAATEVPPAAAPVAAAIASAAAAPAATAAAPAERSGSATISGRKRIRQEWYQNDSTVSITLFAKDVQKDSCNVDFQERAVSLSFPLPGSDEEEYHLDLDLFDSVDPTLCKIEVSKMKIDISLAKKSTGAPWKALERQEEQELETAEQPAYPTSNKAKKDWGQIDKAIDEDLKAEKPAGDEALNTLFKQIYDRADDETRRAMNKSFQTSGGTVLSTNWGEVARSDYEGKDRPSAPDGQEWRDQRDKK